MSLLGDKIAGLLPSAPARPVTVSSLTDPSHAPPQGLSSLSPAKPRFGRYPVKDSPDLERILTLPRRPPPGDEASIVATMTAKFSRGVPSGQCRCKELGWHRKCVTTLFYTQAWALSEAAFAPGIIGAIGVGKGKTLLDMLAAMAVPGCKDAMLILPAGLKEQFLREWPVYREHWHLPNLAGQQPWVTGRPVLRVLTLDQLSREGQAGVFVQHRPDLVIVDEVHCLKSAKATRTGRVWQYISDNPEVKLLCWSGTLTTRSIKDYAHLAEWALRQWSPLPVDPNTVEEWAGAIDPKPRNGFPTPMGKLARLCAPEEHVREGFRRRRADTFGFITSLSGNDCDASITVEERPAPPIPASVQAELLKLRGPKGIRGLGRRGELEHGDDAVEQHLQEGRWQRPDGEEFVDALQVARCARELASGFYYRWRFPRGEEVALIDRWLLARSAWHLELRGKLKKRRPYLDSPLLCAKAAIRFAEKREATETAPVWDSYSWKEWAAVRELVKPQTEAVWIDEFLAEDSAQWLKENPRHGLLWYSHDAFGAKVQALSGAPRYGGGTDPAATEYGKRSIILSVPAHYKGRNLQAFNLSHVSNALSDAAVWEQLIGRTHRPGQEAESLRFSVYRHTPEAQDAFDTALTYAEYIQETGDPQKLLRAQITF